jgi:hypothetical protein
MVKKYFVCLFNVFSAALNGRLTEHDGSERNGYDEL